VTSSVATSTSACGELRGYSQHYRDDTPPCGPCLTAHADWMRGYRARMYLAGGPLTIDATGTRRRLQALARIGHTYQAIAEELGVVRSCVQQWAGNRRVHRRTAAQVAELYDAWSMTVGPSSKSRARAEAAGWPPPLAWDDESIDDPATQPDLGADRAVDVDEVAVQRARRGERVPLTRAEHRAAVAALTADGLTAAAVAERLGTTPRAIKKHRERHPATPRPSTTTAA
jgi:transposase-like protein